MHQSFTEIVREEIEPIRERHPVFESEIAKFTDSLFARVCELLDDHIYTIGLGKGLVAIGQGRLKEPPNGRYLGFELLHTPRKVGEEMSKEDYGKFTPHVMVMCPTKESAMVLKTVVDELVESFDDENRTNPERRPGERESDSAPSESVGVGTIPEGGGE